MKIKFKIIINVLILMFIAFCISGIFNSILLTDEIKQIRKNQIENTFSNYLNTINKFFEKMENNALVLSRGGESIYNMSLQNKVYNTQKELENFSLKTLQRFPEIIGNGIWYEPYKINQREKFMGVYAFWDQDKAKITYEFSGADYNYFDQNWYTMAIPADWNRSQKREKDLFISSPYLDKLDGAKVIYITIAGMMYDQQGEILGVSTTDWTLDLIQKSLNSIYFTPGSFVFLADKSTHKILYCSGHDNLMQPYENQKWGKLIDLNNHTINELNIVKNTTLEGLKYDFYYTVNPYGLIFGFAVNIDEAYAIIGHINQINLIIIFIILIIATLILYLLISRLMLPLSKLNTIVTQFAIHNFSVRAQIIKKDEVGTLSRTFNEMANSIQEYHIKLEEYNRDLEQIISDRTNEIVLQKNEIENQNHHIQQQNQKLIELNATKDKLFSIIAHDLKNPFNTLLGFSAILIEQWDDQEREDSLRMIKLIHNSAQSGFDLLENLLHWAQCQTGRIIVEPEISNVFEIVENNLGLLNSTAIRKNIQIINQVPHETFCFADKNIITTVIRNLISNAIKFTPVFGLITIEAESVPENDRETKKSILVTISDNGMGIDPENLSKLFRSDIHFTTPGSANEKGTGLGLILCKEFVERNGGKIWVESEVGKGSQFKFTVPGLP